MSRSLISNLTPEPNQNKWRLSDANVKTYARFNTQKIISDRRVTTKFYDTNK